MKIEPLGETAYLMRGLPFPAYQVAKWLNNQSIPGLLEAVASYETVAIHIEPDRFDLDALSMPGQLPAEPPTLHRVEVCYELGSDLMAAAGQLGINADELVAFHSNQPYLCSAVGFRPGFAYLGPLPTEIAGLPRRAEPRLRIPAGAVGITGRQTGVYPQVGPGGWWIIGLTPDIVADVAQGIYSISAGDLVEFVPISRAAYQARCSENA